MRNITVALDDDLARWVRVEAAKRDVSVSRFLSDLIEETRRSDLEYRRAMRDYLTREPYIDSGGRPYPSRDDRPVLRRH